MSEWKEYKLGEIVLDVAMGPFGSNLKADNFISTGVPVIRGSNLNNGGFEDDKFVFVSDEKAKSLKRSLAYPDELIFTHRGTLGQVAIIPKDKHPYYLVSQSQMRVDVNREFLVPRYLLYWFKSRTGQYELLKNSAQVGVPSIASPTKSMKEIDIRIPTTSTQNHIVEILSSLDDKIELNNNINKELENLAQTLFKQWFIDFEFPDENGTPYQSSGGEVEESELGLIPKDWEVVTLNKLLTVKYGKDHKHLLDGDIPLYGSGGIMRFVEKPLYSKDSILIPRKGTLSNLFYLSEPFWSVDTMFYTEIHNPVFGKYLFFLIKGLNLASMDVGSAVPSMTTKVLNGIKVLKPSDFVMLQFDKIASSIFEIMKHNNLENQELTNLRDTLLPKLISGEINVKDL